MSREHLYSDHWLLAYEALEQRWLPSCDGSDYVAGDAYFGLLKKFSVKFYDTSANVEQPDSGYNDEDENDEHEDDELSDTEEIIVFDSENSLFPDANPEVSTTAPPPSGKRPARTISFSYRWSIHCLDMHFVDVQTKRFSWYVHFHPIKIVGSISNV